MLAIRLQRIGRKKLPHYRLIAQEHSIQPTSGKVAAYLGSVNPHTKEVNLDQEKIEYYLKNGAQPSNSAAKLLQREGIKLPDWVKITQKPDRKKEQPAETAEETSTEEAPATPAEAPESPDEPAAEAEQAEEKPEKESDEKTNEKTKEAPAANEKADADTNDSDKK